MKRNNPWTWVPSLFFSEGLAFVGITMLSLILYKQLGLNNAEITFYTGWLYLPWVIRPLWRPFLDLFRTRRWWLLSAELLIGAAFGGVALAIPTSVWLQGTLVAFWLAAFALAVHYSVAHDVYEAELVHERRRWFRKVQSIACYLGMIFGQGILVMIAGNVQVIQRGSISYSWSLVCYAVTGIFILLWLWNGLLLPRGETGHLHRRFNLRRVWNETVIVVRDFLEQPQIVPSVLFLLFFQSIIVILDRCRSQRRSGPFTARIRFSTGFCGDSRPLDWFYRRGKHHFERWTTAVDLADNIGRNATPRIVSLFK